MTFDPAEYSKTGRGDREMTREETLRPYLTLSLGSRIRGHVR